MRRFALASSIFLSFSAPLAAQPAGWVALPVPEYNALRAKAFSADTEAPPVELAVTRAVYDLALDRDTQASGRVTLEIDVFRDGWTQSALPAGLIISNAVTPPSCRLVEGAIGFTKKGHYTVQLDGSLPVTLSNGGQRLALPSSPAGITRVSIRPIRAGTDMTVMGGVIAESTGETWIVYGNGPESLALSWRRKSEESRDTRPLELTGNFVQLWTLGEDTSAFTAEMTLDVQQGTAREFAFDLPAGLTVNQVLGGPIADWIAKDSTLTITFLEPVDKQAKFLIQAEAKLARDGELKLPFLLPRGLKREQGGVAVELAGPAEIKNSAPTGLELAEASQLGGLAAARQSPSLATYRLIPRATARALSVQVARYTPQALLTANVEEARIQAVAAADGKLLIRARYAVRNSQRGFLAMTLPPDAILWSASLGGRPVRPGRGADRTLMFPLSKPAGSEEAPATVAEVTYLVKSAPWAGRGRAVLMLPKLDLPISRSGVSIYLPARFRVTPEPGAFRAGPVTAPESAAFRAPTPPNPMLINVAATQNAAARNSQVLVDGFRAKRESSQTSIAAGGLDFPAYGESIFLTAELTAENQEPRIELTYQPERKGDSK